MSDLRQCSILNWNGRVRSSSRPMDARCKSDDCRNGGWRTKCYGASPQSLKVIAGCSNLIRPRTIKTTRHVSGVYEHRFCNWHFTGSSCRRCHGGHFWVAMVIWDSITSDGHINFDCYFLIEFASPRSIFRVNEAKIETR